MQEDKKQRNQLKNITSQTSISSLNKNLDLNKSFDNIRQSLAKFPDSMISSQQNVLNSNIFTKVSVDSKADFQIQNIQEPEPIIFWEIFEQFEKTIYFSEFNRINEMDKDIILYNCKRKNPITKVLMLDEDVYVINLDTNEFSINIPQQIVEEAMKPKSSSKAFFISRKRHRIIKTSLKFIIYLVLGNERLDRIGENQIGRLSKNIKKFSVIFREDYSLKIKIRHPKIFDDFWNTIDTSFPDQLIRNEIYEFWEYGLKWNLKLMKHGYIASKILILIEEWKKQQKRLRKASQSNKQFLNLDFMNRAENSIMEFENTILSTINVLDSGEISINMNNKLDLVMNSFNEANTGVDLSIFNAVDKIIDDMEINLYKTLVVYDINEIAEKRSAIKQFLKFQEDTDELVLELCDINECIYEMSYDEENTSGELVLFDINEAKSYNTFPFGINTVRNLFDITGSNMFRIFFVETRSMLVMEVTKEFIFNFMQGFDRETNIDKIADLLENNREINLIREYDKIPIIGVLNVFFSSLELVIGHITDYDFLESVTKEIVGIWQYDDEEEKAYVQVYPLSEQDEEDGKDKLEKKTNTSPFTLGYGEKSSDDGKSNIESDDEE